MPLVGAILLINILDIPPVHQSFPCNSFGRSDGVNPADDDIKLPALHYCGRKSASSSMLPKGTGKIKRQLEFQILVVQSKYNMLAQVM